jgi:drug/metabolite transporter (DMT)-like permease
MKKENKSLLLLNIAILITGLTTLFPKIIKLNAVELIFCRSLITVIALICIILISRIPLKIKSKKAFLIYLVLGLLLAAHWVSFFHSFQISTVAIAVTAFITHALITVFLEPLFFKTRIHITDIFLAFLVIAGVFLIVPEFTIQNKYTSGVAWGLLSGFLFSLRNIVQRKYSTASSSMLIMMYQTLFVVIFTFPFIHFRRVELFIEWMPHLIILGIFFTTLPHTLIVKSLLSLKAKTVGIIAALQPVYSIVFAYLILSEVPQFKTLVGGFLILSASLIESIKLNLKNNVTS